MTKRDSKIQKRNELLQSFNSNAINTETLLGMGCTRNYKKKTVTLIENGTSKKYAVKSTIIDNQVVFYIIK